MVRRIRTVRRGLGTGKGKGYRNLVGVDPMIHSQSARGMKQPQKINSIDRFAESLEPEENKIKSNPNLPAFIMNPVLTENEVNLLKRRLNDNKIDTGEVFSVRESFRLTPEQIQKGLDYLMNKWKTPRGVERKNNPFGAYEEDILANFNRIELIDFQDVSLVPDFKFHIPVYRVYSDTGEFFDYFIQGGEVKFY